MALFVTNIYMFRPPVLKYFYMIEKNHAFKGEKGEKWDFFGLKR